MKFKMGQVLVKDNGFSIQQRILLLRDVNEDDAYLYGVRIKKNDSYELYEDIVLLKVDNDGSFIMEGECGSLISCIYTINYLKQRNSNSSILKELLSEEVPKKNNINNSNNKSYNLKLS